MKNFISFDLETTGTLSHLDHIIEIGAVRFREGKVEDSYQQLVSIDIPIPEQASKVNGITDEMLKGQPAIQEVLPKFADFCSSDLM
ncbi:MAG: 3'-5' exonuclease, partial [Oligoflexia bacterium]|nr:3'-5' exonuclease [Oligoflexia bacterium]